MTQLLEASTSTGASPFTDAVARTGLEAAAGALAAWTAAATAGAPDEASAAARARMSWAAFPVPHGTGCGILLAATTRTNLAALAARAPPTRHGSSTCGGCEAAREALAATLARWRTDLRVPRLADFGAVPGDVPGLVAESRGSSMRTNPVPLSDAEIAAILAVCF